MSTKSTIIHDVGIELYEETSEPQCDSSGNFTGFNVYFILEPKVFKRLTVDVRFLLLETDTGYLPSKMRFLMADIIRAEVDVDGLLIIFKGGSFSADCLGRRNFLPLIKVSGGLSLA